jgi:hypothetical protein
MTMARQTRTFANCTSVTQDYPWGLYVSAHVLCSDGKVRTTARIAQTADTFFSVPAAVKVEGKTVSGFITIEEDRGVQFTPNAGTVNASLLPKWEGEE